MHRLGIVPQRLLREPLRVAHRLGPFGPGVVLAVVNHQNLNVTLRETGQVRRRTRRRGVPVDFARHGAAGSLIVQR